MSAKGEPRAKPLCEHGLLRTYCRDCQNAYARAYGARYPERRRQISRDAKARLRATPEGREVLRATHRRWWHKRGSYARYGLTDAGFKQLLEAQDGRCAICRVPFEEERVRIHIDHDPKEVRVGWRLATKPRGLLCFSCNVGLGKFGDDPERLARAIEYLREPPYALIAVCLLEEEQAQ